MSINKQPHSWRTAMVGSAINTHEPSIWPSLWDKYGRFSSHWDKMHRIRTGRQTLEGGQLKGLPVWFQQRLGKLGASGEWQMAIWLVQHGEGVELMIQTSWLCWVSHSRSCPWWSHVWMPDNHLFTGLVSGVLRQCWMLCCHYHASCANTVDITFFK
jgi:hypothetical protein